MKIALICVAFVSLVLAYFTGEDSLVWTAAIVALCAACMEKF